MKTAKRDQLIRKSLLIEDMGVPEVDGNSDEPAPQGQHYIDTIPPQQPRPGLQQSSAPVEQGTAAQPSLVELTPAGSQGSIALLHSGSGNEAGTHGSIALLHPGSADETGTQPAYDAVALVQQRLNHPRESLTAKVQAVSELKQQRSSIAHPLRMSAPAGGMCIWNVHVYAFVRNFGTKLNRIGY